MLTRLACLERMRSYKLTDPSDRREYANVICLFLQDELEEAWILGLHDDMYEHIHLYGCGYRLELAGLFPFS
jgi:hypothetical protein